MYRGSVLLFAVMMACALPIDGEPSNPTPTPTSGSATQAAPPALGADYDDEILQLVAGYQSAKFSKINSTSYASSVAGIGQINVYAYGDASSYKSIHPETSTTLKVGVGTVIVREVVDATGAVTELTAIAKAPSGFDDTLGDWWFGETDPSGVPISADGVGRVAACHSCHVPRAAEDYLFGVPAANQRMNNH